MATVHSSPEVVRQIKSDLNRTAKELQEAGAKIRAAIQNSSEWNDEQGDQYRDLMRRIGRLIESPVEPLSAAQPKLEKLAQSLDSYGRVKF
ncbi:MAG: WXG100 family type VII secretion target [Lachnospiraceae bacterium]|jgi:ABC-type transporter Mla subunit MlaD|nr:WXG100 family type VII secretion target [Lachnospiraceae bacterium]